MAQEVRGARVHHPGIASNEASGGYHSKRVGEKIPGADKTPYLVEVMNEICNYETEEIVYCKCTQVGGTEVELNMLGYVIQQDPAPSMVVYPSDKLGESVSENRIKNMIKSAPTLRERFYELRSQKLELQFEGTARPAWHPEQSNICF